MSVDLQFRGAAFAALVSRMVRSKLRVTCLPRFTGFSIDHLDVVSGEESVAMIDSIIRITVPVDAFIVSDTDLAQAPNRTPTGATTPAARITLVFHLQQTLAMVAQPDGTVTTDSSLDIVPETPEIPLDGPMGDQVRAGLRSAFSKSSISLTKALTRLGLTRFTESRLTLIDGTIIAQFGPLAGPQVTLLQSEQWGVFLNAAAVEQLVLGKIAPQLKKKFPGTATEVHYQVDGSVPRVKATIAVATPDGWVQMRVGINMDCALGLFAGPPRALRATVDWSVHVNMTLTPAVVEEFFEDLIAKEVNPGDFGGIATGDRTFVLDTELPALPVSGAVFRYDNVRGTDAGMTISGAIVLDPFGEPPFAFTVHALTGPTRIQRCAKNAKTGSGAPSPEPAMLQNTLSYGQVDLAGCGTYCGLELRSPDGSFLQYLAQPAARIAGDDFSIRATIPYTVANLMAQSLSFVVRTPRGVRLIDLGSAPKVTADASGRVLNARDYYIRDCINVVKVGDDTAGGLGWGGRTKDDFKTRPFEEPDWTPYVQQTAGLIVKLVRATGLDAGEVLRFRSPTHEIDAIADARGRAIVPVLLPLTEATIPALLTRANGQSLEGHIAVSTVTFERQVTLPGQLHGDIHETVSGGARIAMQAGEGVVLHTLTPLGAISRVLSDGDTGELNPQPLPPVARRGRLAMLTSSQAVVRMASEGATAPLNPQPLPPVESTDDTRLLAARAGIHGVSRIVSIPGFAESSAAVALMTDGTKLLLDVKRDGRMRVAGTFRGPIDAIDTSESWAVIQSGGSADVYRIT